MDLGLAIQNDYELIDGIERVIVHDEKEQTTASHVAAKRSQLSFRELTFGGGYDSTDVVWRLWASTIPWAPRPGDVIRQSTGEAWTVQSVTSGRVGKTTITHRCVCKQRG